MAANVEYKGECERIIKSLAFRVQKRIHAAGSHASVEDIIGELNFAFVKAQQSWEQSHGVPFIPYFRRGLYLYANRWAKQQIASHNGSHIDLDASGVADGEGESYHSVIADERVSDTAETMDEQQRRAGVMEMMSERAAQFVRLLQNPPPQAYEILTKLRQRRDYAKQRGVPAAAVPKHITSFLVFDMMGADGIERAAIMRELKLIANLESMAND